MRTNGEVPRVDVGILTIKDEELEAVLAAMPRADGHYEAPSHRHYCLRLVDAGAGIQYRVAVARQLEQGTGAAQDLTRDLITDLAPKLIMVVGIAGAVPSADVTLGDVIVATRIHDYAIEARKDGGLSEYAIAGGPMARSIEGVIANLRARTTELGDWTAALPPRPSVDQDKLALYGPAEWQSRVKKSIGQLALGARRTTPVFLTGPIGSSDRLIKDTRVLIDWLQTARDVRAVEMESAGIYRATRERCPMVVIRGISDVVGLERDEAWVGYACAAAAAFARAFLRTRPVPCYEHCLARGVVEHHVQDEEGEPSDLPRFLMTKLLSNRPVLGLRRLRVLVAEDERMIHPALKKMLQKCGAEAEFANDGMEAVQLISTVQPHLVLSDVLMPRLDGIGLARAVHGIDPSIPVVFMSGFPECLAEPAAREYSCAILEKPLKMTDLCDCLQNTLVDDFRVTSTGIWPDSHEVVHAYNRCRKRILNFLESSCANEVLDTLLRHKLKTCVRACSQSARSGAPGLPLFAKLENQLEKLEKIAARITFGTQRSFSAYLEVVLSDLVEESPHLRIEKSIDGNVDVLIGADLQSLFTMATLELLENARDALAGNGTVRICLRRKISAGMLLLRVSSGSGLIPSNIANSLFEEEVNTKADGMGLALVQAMAMRLGGRLRVVQRNGVEIVLEAPLVCEDSLHSPVLRNSQRRIRSS